MKKNRIGVLFAIFAVIAFVGGLSAATALSGSGIDDGDNFTDVTAGSSCPSAYSSLEDNFVGKQVGAARVVAQYLARQGHSEGSSDKFFDEALEKLGRDARALKELIVISWIKEKWVLKCYNCINEHFTTGHSATIRIELLTTLLSVIAASRMQRLRVLPCTDELHDSLEQEQQLSAIIRDELVRRQCHVDHSPAVDQSPGVEPLYSARSPAEMVVAAVSNKSIEAPVVTSTEVSTEVPVEVSTVAGGASKVVVSSAGVLEKLAYKFKQEALDRKKHVKKSSVRRKGTRTRLHTSSSDEYDAGDETEVSDLTLSRRIVVSAPKIIPKKPVVKTEASNYH